MGRLDSFQDPQTTTTAKPSRLDSFATTRGPAAAPEAQGSAADAALEGYGQTATMGYLPHIQAGAERGLEKLLGFFGAGPEATDAKLREQGFQLPEQSYVNERDENIARHEQQAKDSPIASGAGKFAGIVASSAMMPGSGAAKGAGLAAKLGNAAKTGAMQGAVYNPGDTKGEVDPLQLGDRAGNAALGAATGTALSAAGSGISKLADKSRMVDRVKDSSNLSKSVKGEIDTALKGVNENYITPRAQQVKEVLKDHAVDFNPERLKGVSRGLDSYADRLQRKYGQVIPPNVSPEITVGATGKALTSGAEKVIAPESVTIPANKANRLRQLLDARARYAQSKPFEAGSPAKGETAKSAADILRGKLSDLDPEVGELNKEMGHAIKLRSSVNRQSKNAPISSIRGRHGTDKGSIIDFIDKAGGSKLEKLSNSITDAKDLLLNPINLVKPLEMPNEVRKMGVRAATAAARPADAVRKKLPKDTGNALFRALLELKR